MGSRRTSPATVAHVASEGEFSVTSRPAQYRAYPFRSGPPGNTRPWTPTTALTIPALAHERCSTANPGNLCLPVAYQKKIHRSVLSGIPGLFSPTVAVGTPSTGALSVMVDVEHAEILRARISSRLFFEISSEFTDCDLMYGRHRTRGTSPSPTGYNGPELNDPEV